MTRKPRGSMGATCIRFGDDHGMEWMGESPTELELELELEPELGLLPACDNDSLSGCANAGQWVSVVLGKLLVPS